MTDLNFVFFLSLSVIAIGYIIKKLKIISEKEGKGIADLILNITLPALILYTIPEVNFNPEFFFLFLICGIYSFIVLIISFFVFRNYPNKVKGIALMTVIGFNIGLFAYPLIEGIWGIAGIQHIVLFDFANAFIIFALAYSIAAIFSPRNKEENIKINPKYIGKRLITSVPLMSFVVAVILNLVGFRFPTFFFELLSVLSRANMALTLLLLGIYLNFKFEKSEWGLIIKVLIIRYSFGVLIGILFFIVLPYSVLYRAILLVALILPVGMAVVPFSVDFGYNEKLTGIIVNLTIVISFGLMWIITLIIGV